jgi:hypothetical protein
MITPIMTSMIMATPLMRAFERWIGLSWLVATVGFAGEPFEFVPVGKLPLESVGNRSGFVPREFEPSVANNSWPSVLFGD